MLANILPSDPHPSAPLTLGLGSKKVKIQLFQNMVMLHIKLNGITIAATWHIFCLQTPLTLGVGLKVQNSTFSEQSHVDYQIKGNHKCSIMVAIILPAYPPPLPPAIPPTPHQPWGWGQNSSFSEHGHIAYHI